MIFLDISNVQLASKFKEYVYYSKAVHDGNPTEILVYPEILRFLPSANYHTIQLFRYEVKFCDTYLS